jgi:uncharacterized membrane protein YdbT with pleckstrin-like domain
MAQEFSGQRKGEKVVLLFRRHILTARKGLYSLLVLLLCGYVAMLIWPNDTKVLFVPLAALIIGLLAMGYFYTLWYFTVYIVTNQRVRQVAQKGFFRRSEVDLDAAHIQIISFDQSGVFAHIFDYGTIVIQTAVGDLIISYVPHPEKVNNKLQDIVKQATDKRGKHAKED